MLVMVMMQVGAWFCVPASNRDIKNPVHLALCPLSNHEIDYLRYWLSGSGGYASMSSLLSLCYPFLDLFVFKTQKLIMEVL